LPRTLGRSGSVLKIPRHPDRTHLRRPWQSHDAQPLQQDGVRYRWYVSQVLLQRRKTDAGRVARVPAIREACRGGDPAFISVKAVLDRPEAKPTLKRETRDAIHLAIAESRSWIDGMHRLYPVDPRDRGGLLSHSRSSRHLHRPRSLTAQHDATVGACAGGHHETAYPDQSISRVLVGCPTATGSDRSVPRA
jgi:hypothetical protein